MLMTVEELKVYIQTEESEQVLTGRLSALELLIRKYTNNNFQQRGFRVRTDILSRIFTADSSIPFKAGDTIMLSESKLMPEMICTVENVTDGGTFTVKEAVCDERGVLVTKVEYPADVKLGAAQIIAWQMRNAAVNSGDNSRKEVQSETLSRYSVTYASDTTESDLDDSFGVPKKYVSFLKLYRKARF